MTEKDVPGGRWNDPCSLWGGGAIIGSVALAVGDVSDPIAGLFFVGGVVLVLVGTFGNRLLKGKLELGSAGKFEFELAQDEAREVTTSIAAAPKPRLEVGPNEEDDLTRWLLADQLLQELLVETGPPVADCRFQLYLYDPDEALLLPVLEPGNAGATPGFAPHQGAVGAAWATGEYVVASGRAVWDDTFNLTEEQKHRYKDVTVAAAVPVTNAAGRIIGVLSGFSRSGDSKLAADEGYVVHVFLAEAAARILIDMLKWFSDGYDGEGGRETRWSAR